jgi:amino acid adenylation domain-containing protein
MTGASDTFPCAPMQAGLLYETLSGRGGNYVQQTVVTCHESLDPEALRAAWLTLVRRHPILRTSFVIGESAGPRQRIHEEVDLGVLIPDWRDLDDAGREHRWRELVSAERQAGFEPAHAPLMRVVLCRLADDETRMLWSYHHAILDGGSRFTLLRELFDTYEGKPIDEPSAPRVPLPFSQFARWAASRGTDPDTEAFWRGVLAGVQAPTPAPGVGHGEQAPDAARKGAGKITHTFDAQLSCALRAMAATHELTEATILQGCYALLLAQEADSDDVLFASTREGRRSAPFDTRGMIGLLIVTSLVRLRVEPDEPLTRWLARLREFNVAVRDFEHVPLSELRRWSEIPRPAPIAETLFNYERASANSVLRAADPAWERRDVELLEQLDFPLTLKPYGDEQILVQLLYDEGRVPACEVERIANRYEELVRACVENSAATVASACELRPARRRVLSGELGSDRPPSAEELVPARIREQVRAHPERIAVEHAQQRLAYGELGARVDALARCMEDLGAQAGSCVGIAMARTPELICSLLAVHSTGAAYVPLDPRYPPERLAAMLDDSAAEIVVTDTRSRDALPALEGCAVLVADALPTPRTSPTAPPRVTPPTATPPAATPPTAAPPTVTPPTAAPPTAAPPTVTPPTAAPPTAAPLTATPPAAREIAPEDLSHLIFTSGSTGRPKAVMVEHRSVAQLAAWAQVTFSDEQRDGMLASTSLSFDLSVFEILVTLALGGRVVLVEDILALSDPGFAHEVAFVNSVPSALSELLRAGELPASVRTVALAGEALPAALVDRLYAQQSIRDVWNLYGPSEDTTYSTAHRCVAGERPLIGRPLPATRAYVVDRHLRPVPEGVAGELLLGGAGLARGYRNRPQLTAERFPRLTFAEAEPTRVYRTGDRASWTQDGQLDYHGRLDDQVKIHGVRVEPGELEHALREQDAIGDAAVVVRGEGAGRKLVAYVVGANDAQPDVTSVQRALEGRLPAALRPSAIVALDALPLTPNGKLDRKALPEPGARGAVAGAREVTDATQRALAEIWAKVLDLPDRFDARDDFFELGGDSLSALHLLAEVEERFGRRLPIESFFTATTLAGQAAAIDSARAQPAASRLIPVRPTGSRPPWICVLTDHRGLIGLRNLLPAMLSDQPVYAMQAIDPANPSWRSSSVEQIAGACLRALRAHHPQGPYRLGGHSLGGLVAFEMACVLVRDGEPVDLLMLLDTLAPEAFRWRGRVASRDRLLDGESLLRRARGQAHLARGAILEAAALARGERRQRSWPRGFDDPWDQAGAGRIMRRYHPRKLSAPVTVLHTPFSTRLHRQDLGWRRHVAGTLTTRPIPGDHQLILTEPYVYPLASLLADELDQLDERREHTRM